MRFVTCAIPTRAAVSAFAAASDLNPSRPTDADSLWKHDLTHVYLAWGCLGGIVIVGLIVAIIVLDRKLEKKL